MTAHRPSYESPLSMMKTLWPRSKQLRTYQFVKNDLPVPEGPRMNAL